MQDLKVTVVQTALKWEDPEVNIAHFGKLISTIESPSDLIVLPETFATGFAMKASKIALPAHKNLVLDWMKDMAQKHQSAICGSITVDDNGQFFNRFHFVEPSGKVSHYDKKHLFRMAGEDEEFSAGNDIVIINYKGWRIKPMICYDLRFPVWSRSVNDSDLIIYVANWPAPRINAWTTLLKARAIENQCYVIGANRIGEDGNGLEYVGQSIIVDPKGEPLTDFGTMVKIGQAKLNKAELEDFRMKFPVSKDADRFTLLE